MDAFFQPRRRSSTEEGDDNTKTKKNNNGKTSMRSLMISQVKKTEARDTGDNSFYIGNEEVTKIAVVGVVRSINKQDTFSSYTIEDGTGSIEAVTYPNDIHAMDVDDVNGVRIDMYAYVFGRVSLFLNGKICKIIAHKIITIEDPNEITMHLLQVIYSHLTAGMGSVNLERVYKKGVSEETNHEAIVKRAIHENDNAYPGAYIHTIIVQLQSHLTEQQVMKTLEKLESKGEVFATISSEHYKLAVDQFSHHINI